MLMSWVTMMAVAHVGDYDGCDTGNKEFQDQTEHGGVATTFSF